MTGWNQARSWWSARFRWGWEGRLRVIPVVIGGAALYFLLLGAGLLLLPQALWTAPDSWLDAGIKLALGAGVPLLLWYLWRWTRAVRWTAAVYDWFGAGLVAQSVGWLASLAHKFILSDQLPAWAQVLMPIGRGSWALLGAGLMLAGTAQLTRALGNERLERRRLETLMAFTRRVATLDHQSVMEETVRHLQELFMADGCILYLWQEEDEVLVPAAGVHHPEVYDPSYVRRVMTFKYPFGFGLTGWVMQTGEPLRSGNVMADPRAQGVPGWKGQRKSSLFAPVQIEQRRVGVIRLTRRGLDQFDRDDLELLVSFASQAALVIELGRSLKKLSDLGITDPLTGLFNARHFHQMLDAEVSRALRHEHSLALVMVNSDSMKLINDREGRQKGDEHICHMGKLIVQSLRLSDSAYRYAGDEFLLLLPQTEGESALVVAERIRALIERDAREAGMPGTVSLGVASLPRDATDAKSLLAAAGRAMYHSKQSGKNRVTLATDLHP